MLRETDGLSLGSVAFSSRTQEACGPPGQRPRRRRALQEGRHARKSQEEARGRPRRRPPPLAAEGGLGFLLQR